MKWLLPDQGYACVQCGKVCHGMRVWVEPSRVAALQQHALTLDLSADLLQDTGQGVQLRPGAGGKCQFLAPDRLCSVHRDLGWAAKPRPCRQFPWFLTETPEGTQVGLSFRCTAVQNDSGGEWQAQLPALEALRAEAEYPRVGFQPALLRPGVELAWLTYLEWEERWRAALGEGVSLADSCYVELQPRLELMLSPASWNAFLDWLAAGAVGCLEAQSSEDVSRISAAIASQEGYHSPREGEQAALPAPFGGVSAPDGERFLSHVLQRKTLWWRDPWLGRLLMLLTAERLLRFYARREGIWPAIDRIEGEWLGHADREELEFGYAAALLGYCTQ